jgi:hypothetical protein
LPLTASGHPTGMSEPRKKDPAEFTRDMPEGEGAGEGAPETDEPVQGRKPTDAPGGPAMKGLGEDPPEDDERD